VSIDIEAEVGLPIPGPGPGRLTGPVIAVPVATTSASQLLVSRNVYLMGWSFRETTGAAAAVAELFDGAGTGGVLAAVIDLTGGGGSAGGSTPAGASASGANAALAPTFGGAAGTTAFLESLRITGLGATGAAQVTATLTGGLGGTISYPISVPAGATTPITPIFDTFPAPGLQASAAAQAFTHNVPAFGAGNTLAEASIQGYTVTAGVSSGFDTRSLGSTGLLMRSGVYLNVVSGSLRGAIWIRFAA